MSKHRGDPNYDTLQEREMDLGTGLDRLIDSECGLQRHLLTAEMKHQRECDGRPTTNDIGDRDPLLMALIREHPEMAVRFWKGDE